MSDIPTFDGSPSGPTHGHVGWPVNWLDVTERVSRGLPVYIPSDPRTVDQAIYRAFAEKRPPNSEKLPTCRRRNAYGHGRMPYDS